MSFLVCKHGRIFSELCKPLGNQLRVVPVTFLRLQSSLPVHRQFFIGRENKPYYNDIVVGAVCCRVDTSENSKKLYIMTLGCLYPYRRLGIGTKMVEHILNYVSNEGNFSSIFLHVQVNNESAIEFYKKFGFEIVETKEHYYKRIEPADAHVLQKTLLPKMVNGDIKHNEKKDNEK